MYLRSCLILRIMPYDTFTKAIIRPGTFHDAAGHARTFTREDLISIAASYPTNEESRAPVVFGHPTTDMPAEGWVEQLEVDEHDYLVARIRPNHQYLLDAVAMKLRPRVSASFFPKDHPSNPRPGNWTLRHIGFLGAASPAVPNLPPANLSAGDSSIVNLNGDAIMPTPTPTPDLDAQHRQIEQQTADLAVREQAISQREAALAAEDKRRRDAAIDAQVNAWKNDGKMPPAVADFAARVLRGCQQADEAGTADFTATAGTLQLADAFADFVDSLDKAKLFDNLPPETTETMPVTEAQRGAKIANFAAEHHLSAFDAEQQLIALGELDKE